MDPAPALSPDSDVWSFGISMMEVSTGTFPYKLWATPFEQLRQVVMDPAPALSPDKFSSDLVDFIAVCLNKVVTERASYSNLLEHPFLTQHSEVPDSQMGSFIKSILDL